MKDIKITQSLDQNFTHVSYVNTLSEIISVYKSEIITKFPWTEELVVEVHINHSISSGAFNPNRGTKILGILIGFSTMPTVPEYDRIMKNIFENGINQSYPAHG